jgi:hypothetical protein
VLNRNSMLKSEEKAEQGEVFEGRGGRATAHPTAT